MIKKLVVLLMLVGPSSFVNAVPIFTGPIPYLSIADSPFVGQSGKPFVSPDLGTSYFLEDFEDGALNTPGASATNNATPGIFGPRSPRGISDSVDADDGSIDGLGFAWSYHVDSTSIGDQFILFAFDESVLGYLPTHAGVVWTDGRGDVAFEAFDPIGNSLGIIGPAQIADSSASGTTAEDHFFGVFEPDGISAIRISNATAGIEADHLQYGRLASVGIPEPSSIALIALGLAGLGYRRIKA